MNTCIHPGSTVLTDTARTECQFLKVTVKELTVVVLVLWRSLRPWMVTRSSSYASEWINESSSLHSAVAQRNRATPSDVWFFYRSPPGDIPVTPIRWLVRRLVHFANCDFSYVQVPTLMKFGTDYVHDQKRRTNTELLELPGSWVGWNPLAHCSDPLALPNFNPSGGRRNSLALWQWMACFLSHVHCQPPCIHPMFMNF